jgi:4-amino-4-deoxy-L-arabinose transferase-like glycosyltransferase
MPHWYYLAVMVVGLVGFLVVLFQFIRMYPKLTKKEPRVLAVNFMAVITVQASLPVALYLQNGMFEGGTVLTTVHYILLGSLVARTMIFLLDPVYAVAVQDFTKTRRTIILCISFGNGMQVVLGLASLGFVRDEDPGTFNLLMAIEVVLITLTSLAWPLLMYLYARRLKKVVTTTMEGVKGAAQTSGNNG